MTNEQIEVAIMKAFEKAVDRKFREHSERWSGNSYEHEYDLTHSFIEEIWQIMRFTELVMDDFPDAMQELFERMMKEPAQ